MKVAKLIELLEYCDPEATVILMTQEGWPFENELRDVVIREDILDLNEGETIMGDGSNPSDVFLVEGKQLRYGNKNAWRD